MDPTAFSLALGILVLVLSYSCIGMGLVFSLAIALGTMIAARIARQVPMRRASANEHDHAIDVAPTAWRERAHASTVARNALKA